MSYATSESTLYGMVAEFDTAEALAKAATAVRDAGFKHTDAYSPFPVHGMIEALGWRCNKVPWIVAFSGLTGAVTGLTLEYYCSVIDYPLNVGGKPLFTLPMFFVPMFELTILFSAFGAFFGMWALNGLPRYHHPIFSAKNFERATFDRFFLCVEAKDPLYDEEKVRALLESHSPLNVSIVDEPEV